MTLNVLRGGVIYPPLRALRKKRLPKVSHCVVLVKTPDVPES